MANSDASQYLLRYNTVSTHLEYAEGLLWVPISLGNSGITQLHGDISAGPGSGDQAATLATVNSNVGSFTSANITVNAKGLITAASSGSGGTPAGSNGDVQFNNSGAFGADTGNFDYNSSTHALTITGAISTDGGTIASNGSGSLSVGASVQLLNQGAIEFDDTGSNSVSISAPTTVSASYNLYWPAAQSTGALTNDGSGNLNWVPVNSVQGNLGGSPFGTSSTSFVSTGLTVTITPSSTNAQIALSMTSCVNIGAGGSEMAITFFRNGTELSGVPGGFAVNDSSSPVPISMSYIDSPATTSPVTYTVYIKSFFGPAVFNMGSSQNPLGIITATEIH